ncbi:MAG: hypothetical protein KH147_03850 [Actinomyces graevenitzii]|nr:hypothetical protein [Actinomyces graevenitzii]
MLLLASSSTTTAPTWHPPGPAFEPTLAPAPTGAHPATQPATTGHPSVSPTAARPRPSARLPGTSDGVELDPQAPSSLPPRRRRDQTVPAASALGPSKPAHQPR